MGAKVTMLRELLAFALNVLNIALDGPIELTNGS